jgi:hypothetical protein
VNTLRRRDSRYTTSHAPGRVLTLGLFSSIFAIVSTADAGLMHSTYDVRLTAPVRVGGTTGVEQYSGTNIPFDGSGVGGNGDPLLNTISPTPMPPFASGASRVPRIFEPTDGGGGTTGINADIWIKGPATDPNNVFLNPLDTTDPNKFVELELWLKWADLPAGQRILIRDAELIKGIQYPAASVSTSGAGSVSNPLHVVFKFRPADVDAGAFSYVKVWFDFNAIPEPASFALAGMAVLGVLGLIRRRPSR